MGKNESERPKMKIIQVVLLVSGLFLSVFNSHAQTNGFITSGLIAYYPLNGTANDESGFGNNGTVFGATLTADRFGVAGMAYYFNGTSGYTSGDYISANVPNLPTGSSARTVSLWAKPNPVNPYQGTTLLFWGTNQNDEAFQVLNISSPYQWEGGGWGGGNSVNTGVLVDTNWHFVVQSYDGTNMSMWIDATNYGTASIPISTPLSPLLIGTGIELDYFTGAINEVRIYNRVLSSNEISELYQSFATGMITLPTVTISGSTNQTYTIQYVTNLSSTNWTTLASNIVLQGSSPYYYPDTNSIGQPQRFYRVVAQ
jgi:Concanavalin A-like lectin/glucanases superfamily